MELDASVVLVSNGILTASQAGSLISPRQLRLKLPHAGSCLCQQFYGRRLYHAQTMCAPKKTQFNL